MRNHEAFFCMCRFLPGRETIPYALLSFRLQRLAEGGRKVLFAGLSLTKGLPVRVTHRSYFISSSSSSCAGKPLFPALTFTYLQRGEKLEKYSMDFICAFLGNQENRLRPLVEQKMLPDMTDGNLTWKRKKGCLMSWPLCGCP